MKDYKIAGHRLSIDFKGNDDDFRLLPNFEPFKYEGNESPTIVIMVGENILWDDFEKEIGQFDVGGCTHGVYRTAKGGYIFDICDVNKHLCGRMQSNHDFSSCLVELYKGSYAQRHYALNNCLMMAYAFATATMDTVLMHSSVIRCDGKGYLMTAPSGTGKSTHTHLWYTTISGCDLMNDDNPIVRIIDGQAIVYGSPWSGKTPCYRNIQAPIGGIVRIQQRQENTIRKQNALEAFTTLLPACSNMKWDSRTYDGICDCITKIIQNCNIWELGCLPNSEAAILCHDTICKNNNT